MSLRREKLYERAAKVFAGVLIAAGLLYLAVAGANLAVLPAAFVEAQDWGSKVICGASFALMAAFLAVGVALAIAVSNRAFIRWFLVAGVVLLLALITGCVAFTSTVRESVLGNGLFMGCNVMFGLMLAAALLVAALMRRSDTEGAGDPVGHAEGGAPGTLAGESGLGGLPPQVNAALRARARERKIRFQRARKSR